MTAIVSAAAKPIAMAANCRNGAWVGRLPSWRGAWIRWRRDAWRCPGGVLRGWRLPGGWRSKGQRTLAHQGLGRLLALVAGQDLCVPETSSVSGDVRVFVDQATQPVLAKDTDGGRRRR